MRNRLPVSTSIMLFLGGCISIALGETVSNGTQNKALARKFVLVAGETAKQDKLGHHDYLAGCQCLEVLLNQTPGVATIFVRDGWPDDESVFRDCAAAVFYTDGGGLQAFLKTPERVAQMQKLVDAGVGIVMIHQAVDFPAEFESNGKNWLGGVYLKESSGRGHWPSTHVDFPDHPVSRGVEPWKVNDGWLNNIAFVDKMAGVTPLVWSGKVYEGSRSGREPDVVGWVFERVGGGRSFSFTGLDAHSAWSLTGMRKLVVNGVLWSAGVEIPVGGAACEIDEQVLTGMQTPREPKPAKPAK